MSQINFGQPITEKVLHGEVSVDSVSADGINVLNLMNEKSAVNNKEGAFFILGKANAFFVFIAMYIEAKDKEKFLFIYKISLRA